MRTPLSLVPLLALAGATPAPGAAVPPAPEPTPAPEVTLEELRDGDFLYPLENVAWTARAWEVLTDALAAELGLTVGHRRARAALCMARLSGEDTAAALAKVGHKLGRPWTEGIDVVCPDPDLTARIRAFLAG